jgi:hypothetical protein
MVAQQHVTFAGALVDKLAEIALDPFHSHCAY